MKHSAPLTVVQRIRIVLEPVFRSARFGLTLALIAGVVGVLFGLDMADRYATLDGSKLPTWFSLSNDGAFGELFEYLLTTLTAIALGVRAWRRGSAFLGVLAALFVYLTLDNALALHELFGGYVARVAGAIVPNASPQDGGEFVVLISTGVLWLALLISTGSRANWRSVVEGGAVATLIFGAAGFGVGVDLIHGMLNDAPMALSQTLGFVEDGGELGFLALAAALALSLPRTSARLDRRVKWRDEADRRSWSDRRGVDRRRSA